MKRNYTIELMRLLAAYGVVFAHIIPATDLSQDILPFLSVLVVVPFFCVASLFFFQSRGAELKHLQLSRLAVPFVCWSGIYSLLRYAKSQMSGESFEVSLLSLLQGGASLQLWFIPALICFQLTAWACFSLGRLRQGKWVEAVAGGAFLLLLVLMGEVYGYSGYVIGEGFPMYVVALVYVAGVQAVVLLNRRACFDAAAARYATIAAAIALLAVFLMALPREDLVAPVVACVGVLAACLANGLTQLRPSLIWLCSTAYGVFLVHPIFIEAVKFIGPRAGLDVVPFTAWSRPIFALIVFVLSALAVALIRKTPLRFALLGEKPPKPAKTKAP